MSFESPEYTANVDALGALRILDAIRFRGLEKKTKFYQASTLNYMDKFKKSSKRINTILSQISLCCSKTYAYWITVNYREAYGIYACNGILFNHESPRRGRLS